MKEYTMKIVGCTGCIDDVNDFMTHVNQFAEKKTIEIQLFDASMIFGSIHLKSAFVHALRAFQREEMATHSLGMELLFYASGERQITRAIQKMGIKQGETTIIICFLFPKNFHNNIDTIIDNFLTHFDLKQKESVIEPDKTMISRFGISNNAISSVKHDQLFQLVLEKIALVDVIK